MPGSMLYKFPRPVEKESVVYCNRYRRKDIVRQEHPAGLYIGGKRVFHRIGNLVLHGYYKLIIPTRAFNAVELVKKAIVNPNAVAGFLLLFGRPVTVAVSAAGNKRVVAAYNPYRANVKLMKARGRRVDLTSSPAAVVDCLDLAGEEVAFIVGAYDAFTAAVGGLASRTWGVYAGDITYRSADEKEVGLALTNGLSCLKIDPDGRGGIIHGTADACPPGEPSAVIDSGALARLASRGSWADLLAFLDL